MARIAIVSDIHGNRAALEAVIADLRETSPDLVLHGGDLADGGSSPAWVVDRVRELGWQGVVGNTDEMLYDPDALTRFAGQLPQLQALFAAVGEMAEAAREALGEERLRWMAALGNTHRAGGMTLVHAAPGDLWRAPQPEASGEELERAYAPLECKIAVYGHIHRPFVRRIGSRMVVNAGSAGQPHDGDRRASYLLLDAEAAQIRRVEYDVEKEIAAVMACGMPHAQWMAITLRSARPQMP